MKKIALIACLLTLAGLMILSGCSKDKATEPQGNDHESNPIQLVDLGAIIESVAPPAYTGPVGAPTTIDSMWLYGQYPLVGKIFGTDDPQTLYSNVEKFNMVFDIINGCLRVNENGAVIAGVYVDSLVVPQKGGGTMMAHYTATVAAQTDPITIPAIAQTVVGTTVNADYLVTIEVAEIPGAYMKLAMKVNDSTQSYLQFMDGFSDGQETQLIYANLDPTDSTFIFKGVGYVQHAVSEEYPTGEHFCWAYNITSESNADFAYRMSFFSDGTPGMTQLNCFLGGGNKDTEFALKFRVFHPADTTVCDSVFMSDQVFGPNYTEGSGLVTDYDAYLNDALMFPYSAVPLEMIPDPWIN